MYSNVPLIHGSGGGGKLQRREGRVANASYSAIYIVCLVSRKSMSIFLQLTLRACTYTGKVLKVKEEGEKKSGAMLYIDQHYYHIHELATEMYRVT